MLRQINRDLRRPAGPLLDATAASAVVSAVAGALLGDVDLVPSWPSHAWLALLALTSQVLGWLLISVSLPRLPAALTSVLLLVQPVGGGGARGGHPRRGARRRSSSPGTVVVLAGICLATVTLPRRRRGAGWAAGLTLK